jgi:hypothetical protein
MPPAFVSREMKVVDWDHLRRPFESTANDRLHPLCVLLGREAGSLAVWSGSTWTFGSVSPKRVVRAAGLELASIGFEVAWDGGLPRARTGTNGVATP